MLFREERGLDVDLTVIRMQGWRRGHALRGDGPALGDALAEHADRRHGLRLSGRLPRRGHQPLRRPRDDAALRARGRALDRSLGAGPGPRARGRFPARPFRPVFFTPTFQKHAGKPCGGVQVHVRDRRRFPAYLTYLLLILHARRQDPRRVRLAQASLRVRDRQAAHRHPLRHRPHPPRDRARKIPAHPRALVARGRGGLSSDAGGGSCCTEASGLDCEWFTVPDLTPRFLIVESSTATRISAPPTSRPEESGSFRISAPRATATTGLT